MEQAVKRVSYALLSAALTVSILLSGCGGGTAATKAPVQPAPDPAPEVAVEPVAAFHPALGLTQDTQYDYDDERGMIVNSMVTELPGADAATHEEYPALADALDRFRETAHANAQEAYQEREAAVPDNDGPDPLGGEVRSMIRRADAKAVSIVNYWRDYSGGAHVSYGYGAVNFDTATGAELTLEDLLTEEGKLTINSYLGEKLNAAYADLLPGEMVADYLWDDYTFSLEPDGVTFWFNPYEIASYADGALTVKLYFDADADILKPDYRGEDNSWFVEIGAEIPYRFGAGTVEAWKVPNRDYSDWNDGFGLEFNAPEGSSRWADRLTSADADTVWIVPEGRNIVLDQTGSFDVHFYYAHIPQGDYVVSVLSMENDAEEILVYSADGVLVSDMSLTGPGGFFYPEPPENFDDADDWSLYESYGAALTDPENVTLSTRFYLFGTWEGSGVYRLTPSGFDLMGDFLYNEGEYVLTLKQDLTVTRMASDDWTVSMSEDYALPAGTQVELLAVGEADTVYFRALDLPEDVYSGNTDFVFALSYDNPGEYPPTIDGVPEDELFDGMLYAG